MPTPNTPTTPNSPPHVKELKASTPTPDSVADDLNFAERAAMRTGKSLSVEGGRFVESLKGSDREEFNALKKANRPDLLP